VSRAPTVDEDVAVDVTAGAVREGEDGVGKGAQSDVRVPTVANGSADVRTASAAAAREAAAAKTAVSTVVSV
jgi:hypothetical protein